MGSGQIAGNTSIDRRIHQAFKFINAQDADVFVKRFRSHDEDLKMHTYRELVLGGYLAEQGLRVRYDFKIDDKTPDWTILNDRVKVK